MSKEPPAWYGKPYGGYEAWDEAVQECQELLVDWAKRGYIGSYGEITDAVRAIPWPEGPHTHEGSQIGHLLGAVSVREWLENRPLLSALVVHADDRMPGSGFFDLGWELKLLRSKSEDAKLQFWSSEVRACHELWSRR